MKYLVVFNNSMVVSGCMENGAPLFTVITSSTSPMLFDTVDGARHMAELAGHSSRVWSEEDYAMGRGVAVLDPKAGEVRQRTVKELCINPYASYGGGSGALWAIEGRKAQLTTIDCPHGYIQGACEEIAEDGTSILFKIHDGALWGDYVRGNTVRIPIGKIRRYDTIYGGGRPSTDYTAQIHRHLEQEIPAEATSIVDGIFSDEVGKEFADALSECSRAQEECIRAFFCSHETPRQTKSSAKRRITKKKRQVAKAYIDAARKLELAITERDSLGA